jgi:large subunit ribosomal protein L30
MPKKTEAVKIIRITWIRSAIGYSVRHKATIRALGLRRLHQTVEHTDGPALRGMLLKVAHLVQVEEQVEK